MLLKHTILYLPAQILVPASQFVAVLVWAYLLSPSDVGVVTMAIAIQELSFAIFFMWWSHYALRYIGSLTKDGRKQEFLCAEQAAIISSSVIQLLILAPVLWFYFRSTITPGMLVTLVLFMLSRAVAGYIAERCRAEANILVYSIMQLGSALGGFLIGLILMEWFGRTSEVVLGGFVLAQTICMIFGAAVTDIRLKKIIFPEEILRNAIGFGGPIMLASLLSILSLNAPRFIVEATHGMSGVGLFAIGYGLGLRASSFAVMLVTAGAFPLVVKKLEQEGLSSAYSQLRMNVVLVSLAVLPVSLGLLSLNSAIVHVFVANSFQEVTLIVLPLSAVAGLLRYMRSHTTDQVFLLQSRPFIISILSLIDFIVTAFSSYIGSVYYGFFGVAVGPVASGAVIYLLSVVLAFRWFDFAFPFASVSLVALAAGFMAVLVWFLFSPSGYLDLLIAVLFGAVFYFFLVSLLFPEMRRVLIKKLLKRASRFGA